MRGRRTLILRGAIGVESKLQPGLMQKSARFPRTILRLGDLAKRVVRAPDPAGILGLIDQHHLTAMALVNDTPRHSR